MNVEQKHVEDMNYFELLAWLGIGSSHPGGFPATKENLTALKLTAESLVLDAGCGSGLTSCYLAKTVGCKIIGIDISAEMIEKARLRAEKEEVAELLEFNTADVYKLPFEANKFDLIIAESLTVFLDKPKVYREFYRVLKPGGRLADLEMALIKELPDLVRNQMKNCFGEGVNPLTFADWVAELCEAGFIYEGVTNPQFLNPKTQSVVKELKQDWVLVKDLAKKIVEQKGLLGRLTNNAAFIRANHSYFGYGLICGRKPEAIRSGFRRRFKGRLRRFMQGEGS